MVEVGLAATEIVMPVAVAAGDGDRDGEGDGDGDGDGVMDGDRDGAPDGGAGGSTLMAGFALELELVLIELEEERAGEGWPRDGSATADGRMDGEGTVMELLLLATLLLS